MSEVVLERVNKVYPDGFHAVKDLDLEVADGEFVILVGPSGCGKSTALRMVAGLEEITSGNLHVGSHMANHLTPKERDIAMVFQSYALYPHMTVAENMGFALKLAKVPGAEIGKRVDHAAKILGLEDYVHRKPKALSGGQRQRVAMGRAIVRNPRAFLMDEPLSNLDAKLRVQMRAEIAALQDDLGVTTLYVTHDQIEAMTMGDRVAVLKDGVLQQVAPPQELYDHPVNLFVAGFIGSPAMNFLHATLVRDDGRTFLELANGDGRLALPDSVMPRDGSLADHVGRELIVGIRPEHLVAAGEVAADQRWPGRRVELVERLGAETLVHVATRAGLPAEVLEAVSDDDDEAGMGAGPRRVLAKLDPDAAHDVGSTIELGVRTEGVHLFDPDTHQTLS